MKRTICASLLCLAFAFPASAGTLSGEEIKKEMVGKKMKWKKGKFSGTIHMKTGGKVTVTIDQGKLKKDNGKWWIKSNTLCSQYSKVRKGKPKCYSYKTSGAGYKDNEGGIIFR
ncbi:hypothetical protein [Cohaesibacter gelatinilyticus]|uniref:Uncharacterized protein n=1 Tax=Cohaesibacter gelatinilyticus TaxID=372072 RepID=A0A285N8R8_9HYPH|nr:hypothetical protein [Cohaesibacter gelatinilyticus]SNZ05872.1 hypothetical protein SAMN06265368_0227 [Cohaesibacter gelatinilyticus]